MHRQATTPPALLTKALLRAAEQLGLGPELPALLLLSSEDAAKLQAGTRALDPNGEEWARAQKIVGLFRTLVSLLGTPERARAWLTDTNETLRARPLELLRTADHELVYRYLDAVQKHELLLPTRRTEVS